MRELCSSWCSRLPRYLNGNLGCLFLALLGAEAAPAPWGGRCATHSVETRKLPFTKTGIQLFCARNPVVWKWSQQQSGLQEEARGWMGGGCEGVIMHVGKREKQSALLVVITAGSKLARLPVWVWIILSLKSSWPEGMQHIFSKWMLTWNTEIKKIIFYLTAACLSTSIGKQHAEDFLRWHLEVLFVWGGWLVGPGLAVTFISEGLDAVQGYQTIPQLFS